MSTPDHIRSEYDADFYRAQSVTSLSSARRMLSYLFEYYIPKSVVDVGCGTGAWLATARDLGASEILGIDGDYVDLGLLKIPRESFVAADLERPLRIRPKADLCVSVEVAEHLSKDRAALLVHDITAIAPVVVFGAAVPGQGGTHHVNLQWPSFWIDLFDQYGYVALDCMRIPFWDDPEVDYWYAENTLLYCDRERTDLRESFACMPRIQPAGMPLVHPGLYHGYLYEYECGSVPNRFRQLRRATARALERRLGRSTQRSEPPAPPERGTCATPDHDD